MSSKLNGGPFDKAYFLYCHALEYSSKFMLFLTTTLKHNHFKISGGIKSNLIRIANKIISNPIEYGNPFGVRDMIRATITVDEYDKMRQAY